MEHRNIDANAEVQCPWNAYTAYEVGWGTEVGHRHPSPTDHISTALLEYGDPSFTSSPPTLRPHTPIDVQVLDPEFAMPSEAAEWPPLLVRGSFKRHSVISLGLENMPSPTRTSFVPKSHNRSHSNLSGATLVDEDEDTKDFALAPKLLPHGFIERKWMRHTKGMRLHPYSSEEAPYPVSYNRISLQMCVISWYR
jgi:hypothetical protein